MKRNLHTIGLVIGALFIMLRLCQMRFFSADPRTTIGGIQTFKGDTDEAIATLKKSEKHAPCESDFRTHWWLGQCYLKRKDWPKTKEECNLAIDVYNNIFPFTDNTAPYICVFKGVDFSTLASAYLWRGYANARMRDYEHAVADYTKYIQTIRPWGAGFTLRYPPGDGYARYQRSVCYYALNKPELAEQDLAQLKKDGYWGYLSQELRPNSNNWDSLIHYEPNF